MKDLSETIGPMLDLVAMDVVTEGGFWGMLAANA